MTDPVLAGLGAYRLARLVIDDTILSEVRPQMMAKAHEIHPKLHELMSCGYCLSVWFAAALTARRRGWFMAALAASGVAAVAWSVDRLAVNTEKVEKEIEESQLHWDFSDLA